MAEIDYTPMSAIRAKCLDCCCGSSNEVKLCPCTNCSLYTYRFGTNPKRKRELSDEQREEMRARMQAMREAKSSKA